ncbi:MAG: GlsB/YeaQ/YmgE family stress response membrane protein, partial [Syntrophales bacterium]|nr:GlsB/YeaQ/YmgE family stress response membrane protein [Syntrophales bacterium]
MGILSWIVMGLIVGVLAKFIMPGKDPGGMILTILIGIGGAFVGGFIGSYLGLGTITGFNT